METGEVIILVIAGIVTLALGTYFERKLLKRKNRPWFLLPVKSPVLRFLIALMVGALAAYVTQPWNPPPDGWPLWKALLFIGFCVFGVWGGMTLRYWAYKKVQDQGKSSNGLSA